MTFHPTRHNPYDLDADEIARPTACNCARCGEDLRDAGVPPASVADSLIADLVAIHGGPICHDCSTDYIACADCDDPVLFGDHYHEEGYTEALCGDCYALRPSVQAATLADDRIKEAAK